MSARVLLIDIECAPAKVHSWGLFNQNIGLSQILEDPRIMGFGAKWLGDKRVQWYSEYHQDRLTMLTKARDLLDAADVVVHYNGTTFDTPWILGELLREGIELPSPFKQIDLYRVFKKNTRFISHKLQYLSGALLKDSKVSTGGHQLCVRCLEGTPEEQVKAWRDMARYCKQDVNLLEPLLEKARPILPASINFAIYEEDTEVRCQKCGSDEYLENRGSAYTGQGKFPQVYCKPSRGGCGGWTRLTKAEKLISTAGVTR